MKTGDIVKVYDPSWRDATRREYQPGRNHGKTGTIIEVTAYKCGSDRLYQIQFEDNCNYPHWGSELRPSNNVFVADRTTSA